MKNQTKIFSIFGQIESVAAEIMLADGRAFRKIDARDIPASASVNDEGQRAKFAIMLPIKHEHAFNELIRDLYA